MTKKNLILDVKNKKTRHYETWQFPHVATVTHWPGIPEEKHAW